MSHTRTIPALSGVTNIHYAPESGMLYKTARIFGLGGSLRLRRDPPDPTATDGETLYAATNYEIHGAGTINVAKIIPESGTVNVTITLLP